ncbi:NUDIX hydrolase [Candidatus Gracilibacteria bacterium]|nr:NUDIX hydrolase [Candidatus Gracilibacteria bacterium]
MKKELIVRAFVFNEDGNILLVRHKKGTPLALPGGHIEEGESLHDAMLREIKEETGSKARFFDIDPESKITSRGKNLKNLPLPIASYEIVIGDVTKVEYIFLMEMSEEIKKIQAEEIVEYDWYDPDKVATMHPDKEIWSQYIQILDKIFDDE